MSQSIVERDPAAHRVACQDEPLDPQLVHHGIDGADESGRRVIAIGCRTGKPMPDLIEPDHAGIGHQGLHPRRPGMKVGVRAV